MFSSIKIVPHQLQFKSPILTSRNRMTTHNVWYVVITQDQNWGIGECAPLPGLSRDDMSSFHDYLLDLEENVDLNLDQLDHLPAVRFAFEQAILDLSTQDRYHYFDSTWLSGQGHIPINGLIWMGEENAILKQIDQKLDEGWACLKMKIGALNWDFELRVLRQIRATYSSQELEIRVDANGAFDSTNVVSRLKELAKLDIHSIEQPIQAGQHSLMSSLCGMEVIPIALDEELIQVSSIANKAELLELINPQYIILKPTLLGGFVKSQEWINLAEDRRIGWWITSALESNVGLNAIAQWAATLETKGIFQGLGTGALYSNNVISPLSQEKGRLKYDKSKKWSFENVTMTSTIL